MSKVTITYGHSTCRIENGVLSFDAQNALSERLCYEVQGAEFMKRSGKFGNARYGGKEWDGKKRLYHKGHRTFGTGLLSQVIETLEDHGYNVTVTQTDKTRDFRGEIRDPVGWTLRDDYQSEAVQTACLYERGMIKVATGGGKTVIAGFIIGRLKTTTVFFVHTKDLLYQALDTFRSMFGSQYVGQIGDGTIDTDKPITVCTLQTAARALGVDYEKDSAAEGEDAWQDDTDDRWDSEIARLLHHAGCVMLDECHRVAAPTATAVIGAVKNAPHRYGFSASPWRDDGADIVLESVFGEILVDINASTLIDMGHLVAPTIRMRKLSQGRFPKGTKYSRIYEAYIINNEERNALIVKDALSKVRRGHPTMVLVRSVAHGVALAEAISTGMGETVPFLSGKDDSDTRNSVIGDMRANNLKCLVATTIADEGLDIKPLSGLVLAGAGKSSTRALQRVGRVLRPYPGKTIAEVTDFEDNAKNLVDHSAARVKMYESEPRFTVIDI